MSSAGCSVKRVTRGARERCDTSQRDQNEAGTFDPKLSEEGSGFGGTAVRWEDSHRNPITCDGKNHVARFTIDQIEGKQGYKTLTKGTAWVQFCLFDDTTPKGDGETDFGEPVSSMVWVNVH